MDSRKKPVFLLPLMFLVGCGGDSNIQQHLSANPDLRTLTEFKKIQVGFEPWKENNDEKSITLFQDSYNFRKAVQSLTTDPIPAIDFTKNLAILIRQGERITHSTCEDAIDIAKVAMAQVNGLNKIAIHYQVDCSGRGKVCDLSLSTGYPYAIYSVKITQKRDYEPIFIEEVVAFEANCNQ